MILHNFGYADLGHVLARRRVRSDGIARLQAGAVASARRAARAARAALCVARLRQGVPLRYVQLLDMC